MKLSSDCICCLVRSQEGKLKQRKVPEETKARYLKAVLKAIGESSPEVSAPVMTAVINRLQADYFGAETLDYTEEKKHFNRIMQSLEPEIEKKIMQSEDALAAAMQYARAGNYIDFGALSTVEESTLLSILDKAVEDTLDTETYACFREDLKKAERLVYLTDNCGEIVMDKLLVKELRRQFPTLDVTVIVRGLPTLNDATMEDAREVGMTEIVKTIGNGTDVAGTELSMIHPEAKKAIEKADLLIAKGQGNFETLKGSGLNIYYLFLCKCRLFVERFGMEQFKGVLINERHVAGKKKETSNT